MRERLVAITPHYRSFVTIVVVGTAIKKDVYEKLKAIRVKRTALVRCAQRLRRCSAAKTAAAFGPNGLRMPHTCSTIERKRARRTSIEEAMLASSQGCTIFGQPSGSKKALSSRSKKLQLRRVL